MLGVGAWEAFAFDAATFVVSALLLARVRPARRAARPTRAADALLARAARRLARGALARRWVWVTIAGFAGAVLCVYAPWYALGAADRPATCYGGAGVFGLLESVAGVGAVIGALLGAPLAARAGRCAPGC